MSLNKVSFNSGTVTAASLLHRQVTQGSAMQKWNLSTLNPSNKTARPFSTKSKQRRLKRNFETFELKSSSRFGTSSNPMLGGGATPSYGAQVISPQLRPVSPDYATIQGTVKPINYTKQQHQRHVTYNANRKSSQKLQIKYTVSPPVIASDFRNTPLNRQGRRRSETPLQIDINNCELEKGAVATTPPM